MKLSADDPRVVRIANALAEGCDGRSFASDDAKQLHWRCERFKAQFPSESFSDARRRAFCEFIVETLKTERKENDEINYNLPRELR